jgi:hypothetical protein
MNINEAELITPVFTGADDENMIALSSWQSFLYTYQGIVNLTQENRNAIIARAIQMLNDVIQQNTIQPGYAQTVATPMTPVAAQNDNDNDGDDQAPPVDYDFTFESRILELAGVRTRGVQHG